ncbi:zinc finger protein 391-like isoform X2 [Contarinia nasturtii]|uniref:zinc finger protein 391-like isoform X2 n=1 Tax=Contarinia nasturtii TaxID=265458 RepID=UPI0012D3AB4E|nr:zinc finger protein 391-like isoform X2 [Contarinia nasturtii]
MMDEIVVVHQCSFCSQTFGSAGAKDDHILQHFAQETCRDCDENLIQIGSSLYIPHNAVTCVKRNFKTEEHIFQGDQRDTIHENSQCLFCPQTFGSASEKDDHILQHFAKETCRDCDENLIRIGSNLYTLHNAVTCIKVSIKTEDPIFQGDQHYTIHESSDKNSCGAVTSFDSMLAVETKLDPSVLNEQIMLENRNDLAQNEYFEYQSDDGVESPSHLTDMDESVDKSDAADVPSVQLKEEHIIDDGTISKELRLIEPTAIRQPSINIETNQNQNDAPNCKIKRKRPSKMFPCRNDNCKEIFFTNPDLTKHQKQCTKEINVVIKGYACNICKEVFKREASCKKHKLLEHTVGVRNFWCKKCRRNYTTDKTTFENHLCIKNTLVKDIECVTCGKMYNSLLAFQRHQIRVHSDSRTFTCICSKNFNTAEEMADHNVMCEFYKPGSLTEFGTKFECLWCHKTYIRKTILKMHVRKKHLPDGRRFKCDLCDLIFISNVLLKKHYNSTHLGNLKTCPICGKGFGNKTQLRYHTFWHKGLKPFQCRFEGCNQSFSDPPSRQYHMRSHKKGNKQSKTSTSL